MLVLTYFISLYFVANLAFHFHDHVHNDNVNLKLAYSSYVMLDFCAATVKI